MGKGKNCSWGGYRECPHPCPHKNFDHGHLDRFSELCFPDWILLHVCFYCKCAIKMLKGEGVGAVAPYSLFSPPTEVFRFRTHTHTSENFLSVKISKREFLCLVWQNPASVCVGRSVLYCLSTTFMKFES